MYIVLTKDLPGVAQKNSLMNVKRGYFMNYLQPQGYAKVATASLIERLRESIVSQKTAAAESAKALEARMKELSGAQITMSAKASGKGTLFKALSAKEVLAALKKQLNLEIDKDQLEMEPMKKIGDHTVSIVMGDNKTQVKVLVEAKAE